MKKFDQQRKGESGNVLFLILIAVALFAALSYAVTQSTRSGGGDASSETNLVNSAQLTQYPAGIRTAMVRMIISGTGPEQISFNSPSDFGSGLPIDDTDTDTTDEERNVFHPDGGGATYQTANPGVMAGSAAGVWSFNGNYEVPQIGSSGAGGNEVIAFLPGVSEGLCRRLNDEYGINAQTATFADIPDFDATTDTDIDDNHLDGETFPGGDPEDINNATNDLRGQPFGCFYDSTRTANNRFVYYHVLIEQ